MELESKIDGGIKCSVFKPNIKECRDFLSYIEKLSDQNLCCAKVILPGLTPQSMEIAGNKTLKNVVKQTSVKIATTNCSCILYDKEQPNMTYATFCKLARDKDSKFEGRSFEQLQTLFWEELHKNETLYGMDNEFSLFPDDSKWNLNKLTQSESLIHRNDAPRMPGINSPYVYIGCQFSMFGLHLEDGNLYSINYLHHGMPKVWIFVPRSHNSALEELCKKLHPYLDCGNCDFYLRHKQFIIPPSVLKKNKIPFTTVIQNPGEFVISFSGSYHQGFNLGLNCAEAVNIADKRWIKFFEEFKSCSCVYSELTGETNKQLAKIIENYKAEISSNSLPPSIQSSATRMLEHMNNTQSDPPQKRRRRLGHLTCSICKHVFTKVAHLKSHIPVHDENRQKYCCSYKKCGKLYNELKNWRAHFLKNHSRKPADVQKYEEMLTKQTALKTLNWNEKLAQLEHEIAQLRSAYNKLLKIRTSRKIFNRARKIYSLKK